MEWYNKGPGGNGIGVGWSHPKTGRAPFAIPIAEWTILSDQNS